MDKLLPCPFCGGRAEYHEETGEYVNWVECAACEAAITGEYLEDPRTVPKWNTRQSQVEHKEKKA